ncbi:serine hydrolase domain-containing protein [Agromyces aurantiacus]|uniref:Serine hydrolase domain-containing protein n=1 Tax=Agromyces aurantiacus TaxID=165814 RepID=A0ABV9R7R6_9MICO|nr:serine hydrolase domain-containing protein [Agromyces aurantiacus]MBM7503078.1 CubicO group peptidase (beta-lactamase class C family) [Agromyces aurantiacus]
MAAHRVAHRRLALLIAGIAGVAAMSGCLYGPPYDQLLTGDEQLLEIAREDYTDAGDQVAMAVVDGDEVRTAFVSADASTRFELGSATRGLTGLLLADSIERGEVSLDDTVGEYLDLGDAPAAALTLRQLATHHSELPQDPLGPGAWENPTPDPEASAPPDRGGLDALLGRVARIDLVPELEYNVSDFDAALIGQALAAATGTRYADLLEERVLGPIGMEDAVVVESADLLPSGLAQGHDRWGRKVASRGSGAYSPATGLVVTIDDMIALARAVVDGPFADSEALDPAAETRWPRIDIGYFWERYALDRGHAVYIVGSSAGFSAALLAEPDARRASVLLSNAEVDWPWSRVLPLLATIEE